jgi:hypothetical protein
MMDGLRPATPSTVHVSDISGTAFLFAASALVAAAPRRSMAKGFRFGGYTL